MSFARGAGRYQSGCEARSADSNATAENRAAAADPTGALFNLSSLPAA